MKLFLLALLLCCFPAFALAQEKSPEEALVEKVVRAAAAGKNVEVVQIVDADPVLSEKTFHLLLDGYADLTDPDQKKLAKGFCNIVARVFEAHGKPEMVETLRGYKLLLRDR